VTDQIRIGRRLEGDLGLVPYTEPEHAHMPNPVCVGAG
jgi:hypothetical protein